MSKEREAGVVFSWGIFFHIHSNLTQKLFFRYTEEKEAVGPPFSVQRLGWQ